MSPVEKDHGAGWNLAVSKQIKAERAAAGWTVNQLAEHSGVNLRTLKRLTAAQRAIDIAHLAALVDAFGLEMHEFLARASARLVEESSNVTALADRNLNHEQPGLGLVANEGVLEESGE